MIVKCLYNTGKVLMQYSSKQIGVSEDSEFGLLEIGKEYLVMGMLFGEGEIDYLIDDRGVISACPYQLFETINNKLSPSWYFRTFEIADNTYPYQQAILGYYELCFTDDHYEKLVEVEEEALRIYFRRKIELERDLTEM